MEHIFYFYFYCGGQFNQDSYDYEDKIGTGTGKPLPANYLMHPSRDYFFSLPRIEACRISSEFGFCLFGLFVVF